jgi:hypothetical protein
LRIDPVRNTYNVSLLRRRIQESLPRPLAHAGEIAIEGFLSLPGASAWRPDRLGLRELSYIFDIGLPFALIGDKPVAKVLGLHVGEAVREGRLPEARLWSVVHAAALASHWGLDVQTASGAAAPLPQLEVRLPNGTTLSLDVRRGAALDEPPGARIVAIDMQGATAEFDSVAAYYSDLFADGLAAVLLFEPRFWIGIEQKEWLYMTRINPNVEGLGPDMLGNADGKIARQALRLPLLI